MCIGCAQMGSADVRTREDSTGSHDGREVAERQSPAVSCELFLWALNERFITRFDGAFYAVSRPLLVL